MNDQIFTVSQAEAICAWYKENKRSLPWRDTGDPYDVWLSEIMLQQTRIEAVRSRFLQFKKELPDIFSVASCEDDRLMRLWEGMGYYSRARNLKKCAQVIVNEYGGHFPSEAALLKKLPGIGPYTAGAIASICFEQPVGAVDGNVMRVIARVLQITADVRQNETKKAIEKILQKVLENEQISPSVFNQGLMELGEVVCLPNGTPRCEQCPLKDSCLSFRNHLTDEIPYRSALKKRKTVCRTILIFRDGDRFFLCRRPDTGLLAGLYEFYGTDEYLDEKEAIQKTACLGLSALKIRRLPDAKHIFTHLEWHMKAYEILVEDTSLFQSDLLISATKKELQNLAIPSAFKTYTDWYFLRD